MNENQIIEYLENLILTLEKAVDRFSTALGKPMIILEEGKERCRYSDPDSRHLQLLKAVRIVSGLNASIVLLRKGYTQEVGVIFRTLEEFINDIEYIQEAHLSTKPTSDHQKYLAHYFEEGLETGEEMMKKEQGTWRLSRKKVYASLARFFLVVADYDRTRRLVGTLEKVYSKYVHGSYAVVMELYRGDVSGGNEGFNMTGMLGSGKVKPFRWTLASFIHKSLNAFAHLAIDMKMQDLLDELIKCRQDLENSPAYKRR